MRDEDYNILDASADCKKIISILKDNLDKAVGLWSLLSVLENRPEIRERLKSSAHKEQNKLVVSAIYNDFTLSLARIFDKVTLRENYERGTDRASLPNLMYYMENNDLLRWLASLHVKEIAVGIDEIDNQSYIDALKKLVKSRLHYRKFMLDKTGVACLKSVHSYRSNDIAHSLFNKKEEFYLSFSDINRLFNLAIELIDELMYVILSESYYIEEIKLKLEKSSLAYWQEIANI